MAHCQLAGLSLELPRDAAECIAASRLASARGWQEMGPVDAWFALRLLAGVLLWESLFRGVALAALLGMRPKTPEARSLWAVQVPSYAVSTVHATLLSLRGAQHVLQLWGAPEAEKLVIVPGAPFYAANQAVELSNWRAAAAVLSRAQLRLPRSFFLAYLVYDLLHVLAVYPLLGGAVTVVHHGAFAGAALVAGLSRAFPFSFGWLILGEASTPLLNARWLLRTLAAPNPGFAPAAAAALGLPSPAALELLLDAAFALTFLSMRALVYALGLAHLLSALWRGFGAPIPAAARCAMPALVAAGFCLNLVWSRKLLLKLRAALAPSKKRTRGRRGRE